MGTVTEEIERKMAQVVSLKEQIEELEGEMETLKIRQRTENEKRPPRYKPGQHKVSEKTRRQQLKASIARVRERLEMERNGVVEVNHNQRKETDR